MSRPEWCISFNCPNSPGYDTCYINKWMTRGWSSNSKHAREVKQSLHKEYSAMAQENPDQLIQACAEKSLDLR